MTTPLKRGGRETSLKPVAGQNPAAHDFSQSPNAQS